jgi:Holliday junction DNA helicase RuvA
VIASVSGKVLLTNSGAVTIEVSGVGLLVNTTNRITSTMTVGDQITLHTALIVREDSLTLYGFLEPGELNTFEALRSVTGVGPKSALSILSALSVQQIADAVASESDAVFRSVAGVGAKTAKLIAVSLVGKLLGTSGQSISSGSAKATVEALLGLGYKEKEAAKAVSQVSDPSLSDQEVLKLALQYLAKGGSK